MKPPRWPWLVLAVSILGSACVADRPQRAAAEGGEAIVAGPAEPPGSLRPARVALPTAGGTLPLTFLAGTLDADDRAAARALAPNVRIIDGLTRQTALEHAAGAHGVDARLLSPEFLEAARDLVWVQAGSAGVERFLAFERLARDERIVLTNSRGIHGPAIADHVFAMLLSATRDLPFHLANQRNGSWTRENPARRPIALAERTLLVVGLGGIGDEVARRGHGFGMHVLATRRSDAPVPSYVEHVGKPGELIELLPRADVVVLCTPLTPETEGLIGREALAAMKPGAYLINVARGRIVDTQALIEALESGRLAGACLDVTEPEPLPPDHPLWKLPNVLITPHVSNDAELTDQRGSELWRENLRRFGAGEPLLNVVDKRAGY